jgi:hypothetical protein
VSSTEGNTIGKVLRAANERWGRGLRLLHRFPEGAEGVYLVEGSDGRYAFRYWLVRPETEAVFVEIRRRLDHIRLRGVPVPHVVAAGYVGEAYAELWELVDGAPPKQVNGALIDGALEVLRLMQGTALEGGTEWARWLLTSIDDGTRNFFRPGKLREAGGESAEILSAAQQVMGRYAPEDLTARDIVHGDFGLGNVLSRQGTIVAVVDWSGCRDGSGCFDVTSLWWDVASEGTEPSALLSVRRELESWPEADRATCTAHHAARRAASALGTERQDAVFERAWSELGIAARL